MMYGTPTMSLLLSLSHVFFCIGAAQLPCVNVFPFDPLPHLPTGRANDRLSLRRQACMLQLCEVHVSTLPVLGESYCCCLKRCESLIHTLLRFANVRQMFKQCKG